MNDRLIILCEHAVETLTFFSRQLAQAFEKWGYEIFWMDFEMLELGAWKLKQAAAEKEAVLITFNFIGLSGEGPLWDFDDGKPAVSLWEQLGVRCLNILVDHPMYYYKALGMRQPQMHVFCIDRDHAAYMKRFYPKIPGGFLPLAGNQMPGAQAGERAGSFEQWDKRPYPLVFTANYVPVSHIEQQFAKLEPEYRDFYYEIIESFIKSPGQELFSCIESYLRREIPDISEEQLCEAMQPMPAVDLWIRTYYREKTVRTLAEGGIPVYLFGKDWELIECRHREHLICSGRMVASADCVQAMAQAKLALNTMPWFKDGAHDRIFTAMLQGAAALTDGSRYLKEQFTDGGTIFYYDLERLEELPGQVRRLLKEPRQVYAAAKRAGAAARKLHTWERRAEALREYF